LSTTKNETPAPPVTRTKDFFTAVLLLAFTAAVFWPAARWIATQTFAQEQLKQSFYVLVLAGVWIAWENRARLALHLRLGNAALVWLIASYVLAVGAVFLHAPLLVLAGMIAAIAGALHFALGPVAFRRAAPLLAVFGLFLLLVLALPVLDWPLRRAAGLEAGRLLVALGFKTSLLLVGGADGDLLLRVAGRTFTVAPECNGFGIMSSSLLLGLILLLYRRAPLWKHLVLLPACVVVAFVFNLLRIFAIVVLAPSFPNHYTVLHEIAGIVALYSGLGIVWWLTGRAPKASSETR
jgi:exosortase/archaeosortase family protein